MLLEYLLNIIYLGAPGVVILKGRIYRPFNYVEKRAILKFRLDALGKMVSVGGGLVAL